MFRIRKEVNYHMYEAYKSTCHEWTSKGEVKNYTEDIVVEKEELIMKKEMGNQELLKKKIRKKAVHSMKVNYERPLK